MNRSQGSRDYGEEARLDHRRTPKPRAQSPSPRAHRWSARGSRVPAARSGALRAEVVVHFGPWWLHGLTRFRNPESPRHLLHAGVIGITAGRRPDADRPTPFSPRNERWEAACRGRRGPRICHQLCGCRPDGSAPDEPRRERPLQRLEYEALELDGHGAFPRFAHGIGLRKTDTERDLFGRDLDVREGARSGSHLGTVRSPPV